MSGWSTATLIQHDVVGPGLHRLVLDVAPKVARSFHAPGQYHRVRVPTGEDATFALASAPGEAAFEYLVRESEGAAGRWAALTVGMTVDVTLPDGPGFPLEQARGRNLLLVGTGTGFAPLRSVIRTLVQDRGAWGQVNGAYGVLTPAHLAYRAELKAWREAGVHVVPTVTTGDAAWEGAVGQVQGLLSRLPTEDALAFLCGQAEMTREVTALLSARGLPPERAFLNFGR